MHGSMQKRVEILCNTAENWVKMHRLASVFLLSPLSVVSTLTVAYWDGDQYVEPQRDFFLPSALHLIKTTKCVLCTWKVILPKWCLFVFVCDADYTVLFSSFVFPIRCGLCDSSAISSDV